MDPRNPYYQSSSYLNLLNSQEEGVGHENFHYESYPPPGQNSSQIPPANSQQSEATPLSQGTPVGRKERKTWTPADDEVLISAWLNTSKDPIVSNQQRAGSFWQRVGQYYADSPHARNGGEQMLITHCKQRWFKIHDQTNKFCGAYAAAERQNSSGHSENDVLFILDLSQHLALMDEGRQKDLQLLEEIIDKGLKQKLVHATASRDKIFEEQKVLSDLRKNLETLEKNGVNSLKTMVNLGSEVYMQAEVPDTRHIFMDVGLGFYVEFTRQEALDYISQREERTKKQLEEFTGVITQIKGRIKLAHYQIQQILNLPEENQSSRQRAF